MQNRRPSHHRFLYLVVTAAFISGLLGSFACSPKNEASSSEPASTTQAVVDSPAATAEPTPPPTPSYIGPVSRVERKTFLVRTEGGSFEPFFVKGVDIGAAKPGFWPGEFGIERDDYARWFEQIGAMHANTIRVYVPQMPAFYDALLAYNLTAKSPLYLMQGIYMNEELITTYLDA